MEKMFYTINAGRDNSTLTWVTICSVCYAVGLRLLSNRAI